ncbi:P-loop containing nucleoside triphosphate hydrolase protein, partial [Teratosphaeria nubilosa]
QCHPVLFYAIERNDVEIVRILLEYGADAKQCDMWDVPPVAYAVMRSKWTVQDPTEVIKTLLGYGADPDAVHRDMWNDYMKQPTAETTTASDGQGRHSASMWCKQRHRNILAETLSLSIRYYLAKASEMKPVQARGMQLAQAYDYAALFKVPYLIVGQTFACKFVVETVTSHIGMNIKRPLVMAFAGLSGHGKTELATKMGSLLGLTTTVVDCAQMGSDFGLFGPRQGYHGNDRGSQLNNHLAEFDGQKSVVFMDEFDKTNQEVRNSLLLVLDSGAYHDRRNNQRIDASKTIWIFATNLGDHAITNFYHEHMEGVTKASELAMVPHKTLQNELKTLFRHAFGAPMAGRLKNVAPFYPFSPPEQAVIVRKFLSELADELRRDIDRSPATKRYPGHVHLNIQNDAKLCAHIAAESYLPDLGARALTSGIDDVRTAFFNSFTETDELMVEEMNKKGLMKYTVRLVPVTGGGHEDREVAVVKDGELDYYRGQGSKAVEYEDEAAGDGLEVSTQGNGGLSVSRGREEEL